MAEVKLHPTFLAVIDPRDDEYEGYPEQDVPRWRTELRRKLYDARKAHSDLTGTPLWRGSGFHVHEGLFPRRYVPKGIDWHWMLFSSVNCFLLTPTEHSPRPPDRAECYWLSVCWHGKDAVDQWIDSLPWKVAPDMPWRGTSGVNVIQRIRQRYKPSEQWYRRVMRPAAVLELMRTPMKREDD